MVSSPPSASRSRDHFTLSRCCSAALAIASRCVLRGVVGEGRWGTAGCLTVEVGGSTIAACVLARAIPFNDA